MNAGYIGEQLDLWLVSHNIGSLWYGIGKPDEPSYDGMEFVIMIAIHKVTDVTRFRKDMFKAKRKPGKRGIMPAASVSYYNRIDIGMVCYGGENPEEENYTK